MEGAPYRILAMDGNDLHVPGLLEGKNFELGAGQRYDLLIQLPEQGKVVVRSTTQEALRIILGGGAEPVEQTGSELFSFMDYGTPKPDAGSGPIAVDQAFELELGRNLFVHSINGKSFHEIPPMTVKEGQHIKITVTNAGGGDHPFHIHGHTFRVLSRNGEPLRGSPVYLDTILTKEGESYELYLLAEHQACGWHTVTT